MVCATFSILAPRADGDEHSKPRNESIRAVIAVLLAPALAAIPMIVAELAADNWRPSLEAAVGHTAFTYAFTLLPTALFVLALKRFKLCHASHYALAGLFAAVVCDTVFVSLLSGNVFLLFYFGALFLPTGAVVGVFTWVLCESKVFGVNH